jgi:hypothetical protein
MAIFFRIERPASDPWWCSPDPDGYSHRELVAWEMTDDQIAAEMGRPSLTADQRAALAEEMSIRAGEAAEDAGDAVVGLALAKAGGLAEDVAMDAA